MVSVSKDNDGKVIGFLEWRQVGQSGFDKFRGEYLWINDLWIHSDYKNSWPIYRQMMNWRIPVAVLGSAFLFSSILYLIDNQLIHVAT